MKILNKQQNGQAMVEFAVLLPVLLLLLLAVMYMGMAFYDYIAMSDTARSVGRYASIGKEYSEYKNLVQKDGLLYDVEFDNYKTTELGENESGISVSEEEDPDTKIKTVKVTIQGVREKESNMVEDFLPIMLKTTLNMYKE